ncbi:uncharacterized protein LOC113347835 [Papaver somniferum]|uniref:uncharacterized protein LOC113347835 n=1 Tax=Papaver somniferum TaxID=3469 RepID=UPI000E6FB727|nr:uncharacterized protein LOC113347835 [Papaver somniferum]
MVQQFIILGTRMRLQMTSQSGFGCSHEMLDPWMGIDSSFSTQMEKVRRDFSLLQLKCVFLAKMPKSVTWSLSCSVDYFLLQIKRGMVSPMLIIDEGLFIVKNFARWIYDCGRVLSFITRLKMSQRNNIIENTYTTMWLRVVAMERTNELFYTRLLQEHILWTKLIRHELHNATGDIVGELWEVLLLTLLLFDLRDTKNVCAYILIFIALLGLPRSNVFGIYGNENHLLLQRKSGRFVKKGVVGEHIFCYYCCTVFNLRTELVHPHAFNISAIFSHSFCQMHPCISVHHMLQLWPDDNVCFYRLSTQLL